MHLTAPFAASFSVIFLFGSGTGSRAILVMDKQKILISLSHFEHTKSDCNLELSMICSYFPEKRATSRHDGFWGLPLSNEHSADGGAVREQSYPCLGGYTTKRQTGLNNSSNINMMINDRNYEANCGYLLFFVDRSSGNTISSLSP